MEPYSAFLYRVEIKVTTTHSGLYLIYLLRLLNVINYMMLHELIHLKIKENSYHFLVPGS
jgi:hypothetical protein